MQHKQSGGSQRNVGREFTENYGETDKNKNEETLHCYISKSEVNQIWSLTKWKSQNRDGIMHALLPEFLAVGFPPMLIKV